MNTGHLNKIWESQQVSALTNLGLKPVLRGFPKAARKIFDFLASGLYKLFFCSLCIFKCFGTVYPCPAVLCGIVW